MGKNDQANVDQEINRERDRQLQENQTGINDTRNRINNTTQPRSDAERARIYQGYDDLASGRTGISQADRDRLLGIVSRDYPGPSGGGGGQPPIQSISRTNSPAPSGPSGLSTAGRVSNDGSSPSGMDSRYNDSGIQAPRNRYDPNIPDYLQPDDSYLRPDDSGYRGTFNDLMGKNGGFDETRLNNINSASARLRDTSGNYQDVNNSITGLQRARENYGSTERSVSGLEALARDRGMRPGDFENINRGALTEIERTGGYSDEDKANLRARSNAGVASTYANLRSDMDRGARVSGQLGPGWSEAGFKLARQSAQDQGVNARNTEADIADRVAANRLQASGKLADVNLGLHGQQVDAGIRGFTNAGSLDIDKNTSINNAMTSAGELGLKRQSQIDAATAASGDLDIKAQDAINRARLGGATGLSQDDIGKMDIKSRDALERAGLISRDTLGRMQITSNEGIAAANRGSAENMFRMGLDATNQRFLISEDNNNRMGGLSGLTNLYGTGPAELMHDQDTLYNYRMGTNRGQTDLINSRIANNRGGGIDAQGWAGIGLSGLGVLGDMGWMPFGGGRGGDDSQNPNLDAGGFPIFTGSNGPGRPDHDAIPGGMTTYSSPYTNRRTTSPTTLMNSYGVR